MTARHGKAGRKAPLRITDNALFRWLERGGVIDVPALRAALATTLDRAYQAGASLDQGEFLILSGGLVYIVRDGALITVVDDDGRHRHKFNPDAAVRSQGGDRA